MGKSAIDAYTQHLGVAALELALQSFESRDLLASSGCPIQGIEHQHDIFLPLELAQGELGSSQMADQFEIRRLFADFNHGEFSPFDDLIVRRERSEQYIQNQRQINDCECAAHGSSQTKFLSQLIPSSHATELVQYGGRRRQDREVAAIDARQRR